MKIITKNTILPIEYRISCTIENNVEYYNCRAYFNDREIASSPYAGYFKTENAAIRAAQNDLKSRYYK